MKKLILQLLLVIGMFSHEAYAQENQTENQTADEKKEEETWGIGAHPIVGYQDEYGFTLGAGAVIYFEPEEGNHDLDEIELHTTANQAGQYDFMADFSKYFQNNICSIDGKTGYKNYPDDYKEEDYDGVFVPFEIAANFKIMDRLYIGPLYSFLYSDTNFTSDDSEFARDRITGTGILQSSGLGGQMIYKAIPDGQIYRREGFIISLCDVYYSPLFFSDKEFNEIDADYRHYFPVFDQCVFAFQVKGQACLGDAPFFEILSVKNKDILRGGSDATGKYFFAGQVEFRFPLFWRLSAVTFIGAGEVEDNIRDFGKDICIAGGAGLRIALNKKKNINLRFDIAFNDQGESTKYLKIKEAF